MGQHITNYFSNEEAVLAKRPELSIPCLQKIMTSTTRFLLPPEKNVYMVDRETVILAGKRSRDLTSLNPKDGTWHPQPIGWNRFIDAQGNSLFLKILLVKQVNKQYARPSGTCSLLDSPLLRNQIPWFQDLHLLLCEYVRKTNVNSFCKMT